VREEVFAREGCEAVEDSAGDDGHDLVGCQRGARGDLTRHGQWIARGNPAQRAQSGSIDRKVHRERRF
jgi:hypothetical protein